MIHPAIQRAKGRGYIFHSALTTISDLNRDQIQIFTAVQMETRAIANAVAGTGCIPHTVGIAARHLPTVDRLATKSVIILCGVAGALDPSLDIGEVILDDPAGLVRPDCPLRRGKIFTATQIVATPADKADLFARTHAAAVDMEQSIVGEYASRLGVPMIGLRAISDTASDTLNPAVVQWVDGMGRPRPLKIAAALMIRPGMIPYLQKLNANTRIALRNLGPALCKVIDCLTGTTKISDV